MKIQGVRLQGTKLVPSGVAADSYFNLVALLLPGNGTNGAQNNTFIDSSTNAFTITRNGNTTQGTFSPFSQTGWSGYFDGTGDKLSLSSSTAFGFGTGDFTIELWVFCSFNGAVQEFIDGRAVDDNIPWVLGINGTGLARTYDGTTIRASGQLTQNAWNHVAWVRASNVNTVYVNGVSVQTWTASQDFGSTKPLTIANNIGPTSEPFTGYISNLRIVKGTAVYTSAFTPSTTPLTAISGTSLLTCQSNRFIDNSANAFAITVSGNTAVQAFSPFNPTAAYSTTSVGGSAYFDGNGDYLTVADNTAFEFGSGDFTIEGWFYALSVASDTTIVSKWTATGTANSNSWLLFVTSGVATFLTSTNGSAVDVNISGGTVTVNSWNHIAVSRSGNTYSLYLNGTRTATTTNSNSLADVATVVAIGRYSGGTLGYMNGYISNARIVKGTAVYTGSTYTVPTAPVTAIANTQLLLNYTNGGITDAAAKNVLETAGGAAISTTQSKWGGSSMAFDGSGDYLIEPTSLNYGYGTGDFTIEFWLYLNSTGLQTIISQLSSNPQVKPHIYYSSGVRLYVNGGDVITGGTVTVSTWNHIAVSKSGSSTKLFINGTQSGSTYTDTNNYGTSSPLIIADYGFPTPTGSNQLNGYINDLRITRGLARYTANFTAPTTAFPTQ